MKKTILFIFTFIILTLYPISVNAAEVGNITIEAKVPNDLKESIVINFNLEDGTNAMYRLDKVNNYKMTSKIPVGKHKLAQAYVYNDVKKQYKITANKEVVIKANGTINYKIEVVKNQNKTNGNAGKETSNKETNNKETNSKEANKKVSNDLSEDEKDTEDENYIWKTIKGSIVSIVLLMGLGVFYFIKKRNE